MADASGINKFSKAVSSNELNITGAKTYGYKGWETVFVNSVVGRGNSATSYLTTKTRATNDKQGDIVNTGVVTDIAISGNGLLVVSDSVQGSNKFTRRGDFRQDELGFLKNGAGQLLKAWQLDDDQKLPQNSSTLESLKPVNFANTKGEPRATSVLSISMNLNSDQEALRGGGVDMLLNRKGKNNAKAIDGILFPEKLGNTSLTIGDSFTFTSSTTNVDRTITFGGIVAARKPSAGNEIFGTTAANRSFTFNDPAKGNLQSGDKFRISLSGGQVYTFTAVQGAESARDKTFNTINGLAEAINRISSLKAAVDSEGRLYIAPANPANGLTFSNVQATDLVGQLGLTDLAPPVAGETRFNSLATLRDAVNSSQDIYSLKGTVEGKDLKITSLLATADFTIKANSFGVTKISKAAINPNGTEKERATVFIDAPNHGLTTGEHVRITGMANAQIPDGLYAVGAINDNQFTISLRNVVPAAFPAAVPGGNVLAPAANASWQKVPGEAAPAAAGQITGVAAAVTTITLVGHGLADNDVIYVDGGLFYAAGNNITLPSGYYQVSGVAGDDFNIRATAAAPAVPAGAGFNGDTFGFRKVGTAANANLDNFTSRAFVTTGGAVAPGSAVKMFMNNHGYVVGDKISFKDLPNPFVVDGLPIGNGKEYKVDTVGANFITFKVLDANGNPLPAANGDDNTDAKSFTDVPNMSVNNGAKLKNYFALDQEKQIYEKTYDPLNVDKNLSASGSGVANFTSDLVYPVPLNIYDSLGSSYPLTLYFAKLNNNEWAVELTAPKNADGTYEIIGPATENGLIRQGIVKFDEKGDLLGIPEGFEGEITLQRKNGSKPTQLTIDWENILSDITTGTVTQTKNSNNVELIQNNGEAAGSLNKLEITADGYIVGSYSSGQSRKLFKIPLATFANVNGLVPGANDTFENSRESGQLLLKEAAQGGAGEILSGTLESANVDVTKELLKVKDLNFQTQAMSRVIGEEFDIQKTILQELAR